MQILKHLLLLEAIIIYSATVFTNIQIAIANKTITSTTIQICEIPDHLKRLRATPLPLTKSSVALVKQLQQYSENNCSDVLQSTKFPKKAFSSQNGFVRTVVEAYRRHNNLIIRPDDVWAAIMTQFSFYLNKHAETFREKFVNFKGQKELTVTVSGTLKTAPYDLVVKLLTNQIDKNLVDPEVKKWILPNFSTTTENDVVAIGVFFMATMKKYFTYRTRILCGIPEITLEGTLQDWKNILGRLEKLKEYDL